MQNKTEHGARSTLRTPSNYGKHSRRGGQQTKPRTPPKAPSKSKRINRPSGHPGEMYGAPLAHQQHILGRPARIEEIIQELSDFRETLAPEVESYLPNGKRLFVTPEPVWEVSDEVREDGKVLLIRHPGLGWLGFIIPHDDCKRLAKKLTGKLG
jgi:hypothetical protein